VEFRLAVRPAQREHQAQSAACLIGIKRDSNATMTPLVTIGVPIYKRLHFLKNVLNVVRSQDYPAIELLVSDNGMNGDQVRQLVNQYYSRPYTFRQNATTVSISAHFNQIVQEASGYYFVLLQDDDEISATYISELVRQLERHPEATIAMSRQEIVNETGLTIRQSQTDLPGILSGVEFIRAIWQSHKYKFESVATFLAKTEEIKACGGYPPFRKGSHNDNALVIKLSLNNSVTFSSKCSFRYRVYETSHGLSISIWDLAADSRQFLHFLKSDPILIEFSFTHPAEWRELQNIFIRMAWLTYFNRWNGMYRKRLNLPQWVTTAFALPPIPAYYKNVALTFAAETKGFLRSMIPSGKMK
jgi:glycosyltransferase involved in cell wall biosynthesis